jgi:hypothetical protein
MRAMMIRRMLIPRNWKTAQSLPRATPRPLLDQERPDDPVDQHPYYLENVD